MCLSDQHPFNWFSIPPTYYNEYINFFHVNNDGNDEVGDIKWIKRAREINK